MKYKIIFSILFSILLFSSCSRDSNINSPSDSDKLGGLLLKIDKENAPSNVAVVTAKLSRTGFQTITSSMNILSDSSASLQLSNIVVGTWNLTVEALNLQNVVVYRGVTQVNVLENLVSNISLVLNPVSSGMGSISITVTWGNSNPTPPSEWIDYQNNPLLSPQNSFETYGVAQSYVTEINNSFMMYYTGVLEGARKNILLAQSSDGISWTRHSNTPIIEPTANSWDGLAVHAGPIINVDGQYRMYYSGYASSSGQWGIGLAYSNDGITWTKQLEPVILGIPNSWDYQIAAWSIQKIGNVYYLYYGGKSSNSVMKIGIATSSDGLIWTRLNSNPILSPTQSWETSGVYQPSVIKDGEIYKMVYFNGASTCFGMATSTNGVDWTKNINNPIFTTQNTINNWATDIAYPCVIKVGTEYRIYYSGTKNTTYKIGMTRKPIN
ncbi:MAG: hypothetical protein KF721_03355 [Ignavibacteriaceae bacterium]|nr:hypothetical protein [Ignavibacteriaceae bacterium]